MGQFAKLNGQIRLRNAERRTRDALNKDLKVGDEVRQGNTITTLLDAYAQLRMNDGATIDLDEKTQLSFSEGPYPRLQQGRVYCFVDPRKPRQAPFVITSGWASGDT